MLPPLEVVAVPLDVVVNGVRVEEVEADVRDPVHEAGLGIWIWDT